MVRYVFIDEGMVDGKQYVTVLYRFGGDVKEYLIPLDDAISEYGENEIMTMGQWAES